MDVEEDRESLRLILKERCPGAKFKDDDIEKLLIAGYDTVTAIASASKEALGLVLPTRPGVVGVLVKAFLQPGGSEDGSTSKTVLTALEQIANKVNDISGFLQESASQTRAGSSMKLDDIKTLRRCLGAFVIYEPLNFTLAAFGAELEGGEPFWDRERYEPQHWLEYKQKFEQMTPRRNGRNVAWVDAIGTLITDMERGGVAIYSKDGAEVRCQLLVGMEALWDFLARFVKGLPPDTDSDDARNLKNIEQLPEPSRKRFIPKNERMGFPGPQPDSSSVGRQAALMLAAFCNNRDDVANLRDLDCFDVVTV